MPVRWTADRDYWHWTVGAVFFFSFFFALFCLRFIFYLSLPLLNCQTDINNLPYISSLTELSHCAGGGGVFLLSLVHSGPLRLPYLPNQLQPDHQWRCEYKHTPNQYILSFFRPTGCYLKTERGVFWTYLCNVPHTALSLDQKECVVHSGVLCIIWCSLDPTSK